MTSPQRPSSSPPTTPPGSPVQSCRWTAARRSPPPSSSTTKRSRRSRLAVYRGVDAASEHMHVLRVEVRDGTFVAAPLLNVTRQERRSVIAAGQVEGPVAAPAVGLGLGGHVAMGGVKDAALEYLADVV